MRRGERKLLFESTALGDTYGLVSAVSGRRARRAATVSDLRCERVHYRSGRGVCLHSNRGVLTTYEAVVFDDALDERHTIGLAGHAVAGPGLP